MPVNAVLVLNKRKENKAHTEKQISIDLRTPARFTSQPDKKPPVKPPIPMNIIPRLLCCCASAAGKILWIQVGSQEKIAHIPISMEPKVMEPTISSRRYFFVNNEALADPGLVESE